VLSMRALKPSFPRLWHGLECHWVCRGPPRPTCAIPGHTHVHPVRKWARNAAKPCKVGHAREPCHRRSVSLTWMPPPNRFPRLWHIQSLGNIFSQPTAHRDLLAIARSPHLQMICARLSFAVLELYLSCAELTASLHVRYLGVARQHGHFVRRRSRTSASWTRRNKQAR
jgi:hypothetical protein